MCMKLHNYCIENEDFSMDHSISRVERELVLYEAHQWYIISTEVPDELNNRSGVSGRGILRKRDLGSVSYCAT